MGSFYNHFDSKEALFDAAVADVLDTHGALLDQLTASIDDPAETFACSFRLTGRLFRRRPQESQILLTNGLNLLSSDRGFAPRAKRDIAAGMRAGRFQVDDPQLAVAVAAGALMGLGKLLQVETERDDAQAADRVTEDVLRLSECPPKRPTRSASAHCPISMGSPGPTQPPEYSFRPPIPLTGTAATSRTRARAERATHPFCR